MATFSSDWVSGHTHDWLEVLSPFAGQENVSALEIGSYEGRSTLWFLEHILTHVTAGITCIDLRRNERFLVNVAPHRHRIRLINQASQIALRQAGPHLSNTSFAYIDGSHRSCDVLEDAILVFRLLIPGGVIIFDDYSWMPEGVSNRLLKPQFGIDAFLAAYAGQYQLLFKKYQLAIRKNGFTSQGPKEMSAVIEYLQRNSSSNP